MAFISYLGRKFNSIHIKPNQTIHICFYKQTIISSIQNHVVCRPHSTIPNVIGLLRQRSIIEVAGYLCSLHFMTIIGFVFFLEYQHLLIIIYFLNSQKASQGQDGSSTTSPLLNNNGTMVYEGAFGQNEISWATCSHVFQSQALAGIVSMTMAMWLF